MLKKLTPEQKKKLIVSILVIIWILCLPSCVALLTLGAETTDSVSKQMTTDGMNMLIAGAVLFGVFVLLGMALTLHNFGKPAFS